MLRIPIPAVGTVLLFLVAFASCGGQEPSPPPSEVEVTPEASEAPREAPPQLTPAERLRLRAEEERAARLARAPETVEIVTADGRARLCPEPDCDEGGELRRLPTGIELQVEDVATVRLPRWSVLWYRVSFEGTTGWVSEFNTSAAPAEPRYH